MARLLTAKIAIIVNELIGEFYNATLLVKVMTSLYLALLAK